MMCVMSEEGPVAWGLRADARRNRRRLIEAAGQLCRERGLDASLDEIARRAGVGNATLYRHFRTREALWEAAFAEVADLLGQIGRRVVTIEDPWAALVAFFDEVCVATADNQGLRELIARGMPGSSALTELRLRANELLRTLLERAQHAGVVRADISLTDLALMLHATLSVVPAIASVAPGAWRRHLAITLDGLRPRADSAALPPAQLTYEQLLTIGVTTTRD
jgi:AcrR family transcriptional regulator